MATSDKTTSGQSVSPAKRSWDRLLRNKPAVFGMITIILAIVLAILGYLVTPDATPNANDQILQITNKAPGFTTKLLKVRKNREINYRNVFDKMMYGQQNPYDLLPIGQFRFTDSSVIVDQYTREGGKTKTKEFGLANVVYPLAIEDEDESKLESGAMQFTTFENEQKQIVVEKLQKKVEQQHIENRTFYLGTDKFGRDILSRLVIGVRISLSVGLVAVVISLIIGITIGAMAGYFRGVLDDILMWLINVIWSIPALLLVFAITLALGKGFWQIFVAVGLTMWVEVARIIRGQFLSLREMQFVEAAQSMGFSNLRTISRHILPNVIGPLSVIAAANFATAILVEAGLSFLGIGVQPPIPSWGGMLNENYGYIIGNNPFLAIIPGLAIMIMVLAFNLIGNGLRDAMDVRTSTSGK